MKFIQDCLMTRNITPILFEGVKTLPKTLDFRDLVLHTEDQGQTSECACFSATSYAEAINWRKTGVTNDLDPHKVYLYAKKHDGYENTDGTTLDWALKGLIYYNMIDAKDSDVVCFQGVENLKRVIHKYNTCLVGFEVTESWMRHYGKLTLSSSNPGRSYGGHCVTACGYLESGLLIQNSWSQSWGKYGFGLIPWDLVDKQMMYGAYIKNCLDGLN